MRPFSIKRPTLFMLAVAVLALGLTAPAVAQDAEEMCRAEEAMLDKHGYLRALSLELRGVIPTVEEHETVETMGEVPSALIDEWMASEEFAGRVVRNHAALLWPSIANVRLIDGRRRFRATEGRYWVSDIGDVHRGARVPCLDEPARFGAGGEILTTTVPAAGLTPETQREGWVMVTPYWAPETPLKVCAFEAQTNAFSDSDRDCATRAGSRQVGCGCGDNLNWCDVGSTHALLVSSFAEDVKKRIAAAVMNDEPYTSILTSRRAFVNGPLVHFWREQSRIPNAVSLVPAGLDPDRLPDLAFTDTETWVEIELPAVHSGVLTSPLFLLRFQTNRARANRFYDAFLCQPFQPPASGIPFDDVVAEREPDLQIRTGCNYCHALLEPGAAYWGRWTQQGGGVLPELEFPTFRQECRDCAQGLQTCSDECRQHYLIRAVAPEQAPYLGMLRSFEFLRPEHVDNVNHGPSQLVQDTVLDNRLPSCTSRRTVQWLMGRDPIEAEEPWMEELSQGLLHSDLNYRELVRNIVTSDTFRRVR